MASERVRITVRTRWETGERCRLVLDAPRIGWDPDDLIELGRRTGEAAGIIAEPVTTLEIALRWPHEAGAGVLLDPL